MNRDSQGEEGSRKGGRENAVQGEDYGRTEAPESEALGGSQRGKLRGEGLGFVRWAGAGLWALWDRGGILNSWLDFLRQPRRRSSP